MPTEHDDHDKKREWLSDSIKVAVLIWSAGLLTASYVRLPSGQKIMDFDPTFIASVFSGSLAGFGITAAAKSMGNANGNANGAANANEMPIYARPKDEEEKSEPEVMPVWEEPTPSVDLESRVEALEAKVEPSDEVVSEEKPYQRGEL